MIELSKQFNFDVAHKLENTSGGETNNRLHGHSYIAEVTLRGEPDPKTGMLFDLGAFEEALAEARQALDHRYLNEIEGLEVPTMENIAKWLWDFLEPKLPHLARITIHRPGNGENCTYYPAQTEPAPPNEPRPRGALRTSRPS